MLAASGEQVALTVVAVLPAKPVGLPATVSVGCVTLFGNVLSAEHSNSTVTGDQPAVTVAVKLAELSVTAGDVATTRFETIGAIGVCSVVKVAGVGDVTAGPLPFVATARTS